MVIIPLIAMVVILSIFDFSGNFLDEETESILYYDLDKDVPVDTNTDTGADTSSEGSDMKGQVSQEQAAKKTKSENASCSDDVQSRVESELDKVLQKEANGEYDDFLNVSMDELTELNDEDDFAALGGDEDEVRVVSKTLSSEEIQDDVMDIFSKFKDGI